MSMVTLKSAARTSGCTAKALRLAGKVPCVLYGNDTENLPLECEYKDMFRAYTSAGKSTLVELDAHGKKIPVLFHSIDVDPISDRIVHVDFYAVDMKKEIEATVRVRFVGEAPAVKDLGGILVTPLDSVTVLCLPSHLPHDLEVDIASLENFGDSLSISDIVLPSHVQIVQVSETVIVTVQEPRREEIIEKSAEIEGEIEETEGEKEEGGAEGGEAQKEESKMDSGEEEKKG